MKMIALVAAGLLAVVGSAPASAQMQERHTTRVVTRTVVHSDTDRHDDNGRYNNRRHYNNGRHNGWRNHARHSCTTHWRNHHRVRVCRTVRF